MINLILTCMLAGVIGAWVITTLIARIKAKSLLEKARERLVEVDEEVEKKRREIELEKKEELHRIRSAFEKDTEEKRDELHQLSKKLIEREEVLDHRLEELEQRNKKISTEEQKLEKDKEITKDLQIKWREELERVAGISTEEAKRSLLESIKKEARNEAAQIIQQVEKEARETANKKARKILAIAIQRCAVDEATDTVISTLTLPNDEMKGRVIGREGRNIRTFEALTGVDLIVDDTPETVVISCFDPIRRKIAEVSLERLIADSRIHPARIEEIVEKTKSDIEEITQEEGQRTAFDIGIPDLSSELTNLLGKLKYRTSYGQNVLQHSKEVAYIASIIAAEINTDYIEAKRAGLLHDIGKAVDQEMKGPHALIGAHLAERHGESDSVVHAIAAHHEDQTAEAILAILIQVADAISAARPGARKEVLEAYLKRIEELEQIANSFSGVENAYAIQAGRELRIIVQPQEITDGDANELSRKIAQQVEKELKYPGQIKITVIRELRATEYAK
ncbi:ribonuclease Y [Candidatus Aerophobetes bacterium]|uniref:Ribonuclease Y n=1 Tax=Aerophobetes bacterium TaxID=2030807 RepID=A0A523Y101_UNCAE|nr:MAG: ribonuclease Y [Candidatus Aerophobetes bacterium]